MSATSRSTGFLLTWLLALALLVSVGVNVYCLTPGYRSARSVPASVLNDLDDDDDNDDDESWAALTEELRATRQQLAACQGQAAPNTTATAP
ncbi:hypothetical protein [Hymenobacter fodinae]|uniref:Uncharacterized protein n=1 Tax=Hymenobacter fodinae TaxID=2510796 RepID=A0A4Z0PAE0_9BACT|nr:hypothetical protein [Hymenobacter fodinae]TGE09585.1 hypothetical protein EU556_01760 [Hymenobacter fodinae]